MKVAYLLYPGFTALDVVGTFQVPAAAPGTYLGLDRTHRKAVIVLSDVANPATTDLGITLLARHT